jgi:hypothetical protein
VVQAAAPRPDGGRISQQTHFHGHIPTQSTLVPAFQAKLVHFPAEKAVLTVILPKCLIFSSILARQVNRSLGTPYDALLN